MSDRVSFFLHYISWSEDFFKKLVIALTLFITWPTSSFLHILLISSILSQARGAKQDVVDMTHNIWSGPYFSMVSTILGMFYILQSWPAHLS